jgi:uncharacterized membrane-anchored protein
LESARPWLWTSSNSRSKAFGGSGTRYSTREQPAVKGGLGYRHHVRRKRYVSDKGAAEIDYKKLLKEMQQSTEAANEDRRKDGYERVTLLGWVEPPMYGASAHKMYWAKDLLFCGSGEHTLNYNIRILGRRGVLVLTAVSSMDRLETIRTEARSLLPAVDFNEGHRYADYLPGKDKAAAYGLAGLVVGATAAQAGFFKLLWVGILAFKKAIVVAVVALVGAIRRLFRGKQAESSDAAGVESGHS